MNVVIGTAGHIDHGKTALVKALTGVDADRLPEEKQRGITIDLGFAELQLGDLQIGFVDVPGHERFVKNMLAGASGIDLVMLIIAADEGVMPQTREHFEICRLLDTRAGVVVITKTDLVDDEMLDLVKLETSEFVADSFLENSPVISVSAKTGHGINELKSAIATITEHIPERKQDSVARLSIDRCFTVKGFGAVVTGTLISGEMREGDELEILPQKKTVRVRGIQTHGRVEKHALAGQRVAINLAGVDHSDILRGMVLAGKEILRSTQIFDAAIEVVKDAKRSLRTRQRVRVHIGTVEVLARVQVLNKTGEIEPGKSDFAQIRLETPIIGTFGDRFIIRSYSPQATVAGGKILDPFAPKRRKREFAELQTMLSRLVDPAITKSEVLRAYIEDAGSTGLTIEDLHAKTGWRREILTAALNENMGSAIIVMQANLYLSVQAFEEVKAKLIEKIESHHKKEPLSKGLNREQLRENKISTQVFDFAVGRLHAEGKITLMADTISLASRTQVLTAEEASVRRNLIDELVRSGLQVPKLDDLIPKALTGLKMNSSHARKIFQLLLDSGDTVKVSDEFYFAKVSIEDLVSRLRDFAEKDSDRTIDVPKFKEIAGVSRKYAIPLLEYFDREKITIRSGDKRIIS